MASTKLIIADDHQLFREGLKTLIESKIGRVEVIGEAATGIEAIKLARKLEPDLILMDISMPELNGIEAVRQITSEQSNCKIIALSMHQSTDFVTQMLGAGARGYLHKNAAFAELDNAIQTVAQGDVYLSRDIANTLVLDYQRITAADVTTKSELTSRERQVLQLVAEGNRTRSIADKLNVSPKTVEAHRSQIVRKLHVNGVAEMTKYAIRVGISSLDS